MRRAAPLAAIVLLLLAVACGTEARKHENAQTMTENAQVKRANAQAAAKLRAALPAMMAYFQDHNSFAGMTPSKLRETIDAEFPAIRIVSATKKTYCIEVTVNGASALNKGPSNTPWRDNKRGHCPV
jgi:hypothetical protein